MEEESQVKEPKWNRVIERKRLDIDFEDERNVHESRNTTLEVGKGEETNSSLMSPKTEWYNEHSGFSQVKMILDIWLPEL